MHVHAATCGQLHACTCSYMWPTTCMYMWPTTCMYMQLHVANYMHVHAATCGQLHACTCSYMWPTTCGQLHVSNYKYMQLYRDGSLTLLKHSGRLVDLLQQLGQSVHVPVLEEHLRLAHLEVGQLRRLQDLTAAGEGRGHIRIIYFAGQSMCRVHMKFFVSKKYFEIRWVKALWRTMTHFVAETAIVGEAAMIRYLHTQKSHMFGHMTMIQKSHVRSHDTVVRLCLRGAHLSTNSANKGLKA